MLTATTSPLGTQKAYLYVAVVSRYEGRLLLSRHAERATWETQGGHIEPGEMPLAAARRELFEEAGAVAFTLTPVCDYSAAGTHGVFFFADITRLGPLPQSEMAEVQSFAALPPPEQLTYPGITPVLFERARGHFGA
ncbi:NUDIX domain-containing protein [Ruminococcaceae bacterium OttesenSCG-928-A11]|nr:NUDIX domain-containing protein [Ruminococcaceae bacterium OttesenSCG-928-A11]